MKPRVYVQTLLTETLTNLFGEDKAQLLYTVEMRAEETFGDYSTNCAFVLAPHLKQSPQAIAQKIVDHILSTQPKHVTAVEIAGEGFVNIFLSDTLFFDSLSTLSPPKQLNLGKNQKIIVEYSSPNVAKPMHAGHLRATVLGDFLARLYAYTGYKVIRWNHLGDWGTQFGKLIVAYKLWGDDKDMEQNLMGFYVRFHKEAEKDPSLEERAQEEFKKLEAGDKENKKLLRWFLKTSIAEYQNTYDLLGISFDKITGESFYNKYNKKILSLLKDSGLAHQSEGAWVVPIEGQENPALVQKSDGATLYLTRDLSSLWYRLKKHPRKILYVVGDTQILHFKQLFAVADKLGWGKDVDLKHVAFGLVMLSQDNKKMKLSTRKGVVVKATQLIDDAMEAAKNTIRDQSISQDEKDRIKHVVGVGAIKYSMLKDNRTGTITLDMDSETSLKGNSAPYLQYTYARLSSIVHKAGQFSNGKPEKMGKLERGLIKRAAEFEAVLSLCIKTSSSHNLTEYLFELSNAINHFYEEVQILSDTELERRDARLTLIDNLRSLLKTGLDILGIEVLETI